MFDLVIKMEKQDGSLLERFEITDRSYNPETELETMVIKEVSFFPNPKEIVSTVNQHIQALFGYRDVITKIEAELDGLPIFDEKTYDRIRGYWTQTEKFISDYNRLIESLEKRETHKVQLIDKDQYFLKKRCLAGIYP